MTVRPQIGKRTSLACWIFSLGIMFAFSFSPDRFIRANALVDDEASYFSHAMTVGMDFDLDYSNEIATVLNCDGTVPSHPIGTGLLAAPFVAFFGIADRLTGHPVISDRSRYADSWSFFGFVFSANVYLLLGILLYFDAMVRIFRHVRLSHVTLFVFSTGMVHYALYAVFMAHAFEFAALAFTVWASARLYSALKAYRATLGWHLVTSLSVVLNILVRYNNLNVTLLPLTFVILASLLDADERKPGSRRLAGLFPRQALFLALAFVPAALLFHTLYGQVFPTRSVVYCHSHVVPGMTGLFGEVGKIIRLLPNLPLLIFGSELGLLYSNPCLVLGFAAILTVLLSADLKARSARAAAFVMVVLYYSFSVSIVLSWQTVATAYGYRYLFPLVPIGMLGVVLWVDKARTGTGRAATNVIRRGLVVLVFCLCIYSMLSQVFSETTEALTPRRQVNAYGVMHARSYRGFSRALIGELLKPGTWVSLAANRFPGFIGGGLVLHGPLRRHVPQTVMERVERAYGAARPVDYAQAVLLFLTWLSAGVLFYRIQRRREPAGRLTDHG